MDVLRGPAHRQRPARRAPRRGPGLQGCLPPLQDDAGPPRGPQGRLGLPRPARRDRGGEGARLLGQGRHRGIRRRGVQPEVPRVGRAPRRRVHRDDGADGLLGRHDAALPHHGHPLRRERLVVAQAGVRARSARAGPPGRALLPPLWHRPVRPRARAGLRDRRRPERLRAVPADQRAVRRDGCPARVDHHAVDARLQHRRRGAPRRHLRDGPQRGHRRAAGRRRAPGRVGAGRGVAGGRTGSPVRRWSTGATSGRSTSSTGRRTSSVTSSCLPTTSPPTTAPGWCTRPPRSARRTSRSAGSTACRWSTRCARTVTSRTRCALSVGSSSRPPTPRWSRT